MDHFSNILCITIKAMYLKAIPSEQPLQIIEIVTYWHILIDIDLLLFKRQLLST